MNAGGEAALSLGPGTKLPPSVLIGQAEALSTVPGGGRALAYMFPGRLLDRLHPQLGMGVQTGKVGRDRWEVFSSGAARPALGRPVSWTFLLPLAKARALSKQWAMPEASVHGPAVWGAVSVWRATGDTARPVQNSKRSVSKGRAPGHGL